MKTIKAKRVYIIVDWTGHEMAFGRFKSEEAGFAYLQNKFPNNEDLGEYYVVDEADVFEHNRI